MIVGDYSRHDLHELRDALSADLDLLLDAADVALKWADDKEARRLERYLLEARSVYCVGTDSDDDYEIQYRQLEEMSELIEVEAPSRRYREGGEQCTNCSRPRQEPHIKGGSRRRPTVRASAASSAQAIMRWCH